MGGRQGEVFEHWDRWKWWIEWTAHRWEISWVLSLYRTGSRLVMDQSDKKGDYKLFLRRLNMGKQRLKKEHCINKHSYIYIFNMSRKSRSYVGDRSKGVSLIYIVTGHWWRFQNRMKILRFKDYQAGLCW